jgi:hypothetical protein
MPAPKAESLIRQGNLATPQLTFSAYHNTVGEIEVGYALLASPFYWLAQQAGRFNNIQVVMLLNPLLTAATGAIIYAAARTLGYSHRGSVLSALAYGLTTLAWPYSRSLCREPLVGLGWSLGLYGLILWRYRGRANRGYHSAANADGQCGNGGRFAVHLPSGAGSTARS